MKKIRPKEYRHAMKCLLKYFGKAQPVKKLLDKAFNGDGAKILTLTVLTYLSLC